MSTTETNDLKEPTYEDVLAARELVYSHLRPTPLYEYKALGRRIGCQAFVKHENHHPIGAFKVRGGVNLVGRLSVEEKRLGLITASTGNHGQSIAFASRIFGAVARICVPRGCNPAKRTAMQDLGAELIEEGKDFDEARQNCERLATERGYRYVHSGNEPDLIAGVGTLTLEILKEAPDVEYVIVPVGGGSGAAAACLVAKAVNPQIQVIGVQAEAAPAAFLTWKDRGWREAACATFAEGLATRAPFSLPQAIMQRLLDDFVLVSEEQLRQAVVICIEDVHNLAEGAGAAAIAGAMKIRDRLQGKKVAMILSGGNLSIAQLRDVLGT